MPILLVTLVSLGNHSFLKYGNNPLTQLHLGFAILAVWLLLYIKLDPPSGVVSSIIYLLGYILGNYSYIYYGENHLQFVLWAQIISWGFQFAAHAFLENRRPALVDNLFLTMAAPLFVVIEVMFFFGYKPHLYQMCEDNLNKKDK